jgi:adenylate cyclase
MRWLGQRGRRIRTALLAAAVPAGVVYGLTVLDSPVVQALRDLVFDNYQRLSPRLYNPELPIRVIAIDEESLARHGQWPWPRQLMAQLVDRLGAAGAAAIGLDIALPEPERTYASGGIIFTAGDDALATVLRQRQVAIGQLLSTQTTKAPIVKRETSVLRDADPLNLPCRVTAHFSGAIPPLDILAEAAAGVGALNFLPDRDLVVRTIPTLFCVNGKDVPNLGLEILRLVQGERATIQVKMAGANEESRAGRDHAIAVMRIGEIILQTARDGSVRVHYAGERAERRIPAWRVLDGSADLKGIDGGIAIVGGTAAALYDIRATPLEPVVPGVDTHAEFLEHILSGTRLSRPDWAPGVENVVVILGCLLAAFIAVFLRPFWAAAALLVILTAVICGSWYGFTGREILIDPALPVLAISTSFTAAIVGQLRRTDIDKRRIREAFGRYLSPQLVEALANDPSRLNLGGEIRPITVLFSDVRGFTSRSEQLGAEDVLSFLNAVHSPLAEEVFKFGGTLDKFIGDGLMAFWNAPVPMPDHVRAALRCAIAMQAALTPIDEALVALDQAAGRPHIPLAVGIGINTGSACVGNVGSQRRFDYSAIGDTVNTAARIEQTSKMYGIPIIVSEDVVHAAPDFTFLQIDEAPLRGRQQATALYALIGEGEGVASDMREFKMLHDLALAAYLNGGPDTELRIGICARHPQGQRFALLYEVWRNKLAAKKMAVTAVVEI